MRRAALALLLISALMMLVAFAAAFAAGLGSGVVADPVTRSTPRWASALMAAATGLCLAAFMGVALGERVRDVRIAAVLAFVGLGVGGALMALLWVPPVTGPDDALWGGLPLGAALVVYGIGLLPMLIVPVVYAWTFELVAPPSQERR